MINTLKDWIKPDLVQPEAFWFYGQFVCTLWCICLHKNESIFNNRTPNPSKVLFHQKSMFLWLNKATKERTQDHINSEVHIHKQSQCRNNTNHQHPSIERAYAHNHSEVWMFIKVKKIKEKDWFGASALIRGPTG